MNTKPYANRGRPARAGKKLFRAFSPRRLRLGYRAIKQRCARDTAFKPACFAAIITVLSPPLGLFVFWYTLANTMPKNILDCIPCLDEKGSEQYSQGVFVWFHLKQHKTEFPLEMT